MFFFFSNYPCPAVLARKLGTHILTKTMERRPEVGLDSYDRLFPNQDTLPVGGFGNLIALPLQRRFPELGNSVFLGERFAPPTPPMGVLSFIRPNHPPRSSAIVP